MRVQSDRNAEVSMKEVVEEQDKKVFASGPQKE